MTQREITKVDIVSTAKVFAAMYGTIGFVAGLFIALLGAGTPILSGIGFLAVILLPIVYGFMGLISGIIMAILYNFVVKYTDGIKVEVN
ncbi:MAG: hypothetical protein KAT91_01915 [Candidatus Aenigmarchaeota archaeon]|nr:hypothetical protein [Candidatus Aenigmarchaeota archaeon]